MPTRFIQRHTNNNTESKQHSNPPMHTHFIVYCSFAFAGEAQAIRTRDLTAFPVMSLALVQNHNI